MYDIIGVMRVTLNLDDDVFELVKRYAKARSVAMEKDNSSRAGRIYIIPVIGHYI